MHGLYPGSFDPVTNGHTDIITRAAKLCDTLTVLVSFNPDKAASFSPEERLDLLNKVTADLPNVKCDMWGGLLIDYFDKVQADVVIKGLRAVSDFEHEFQQAHVNKELCAGAETIFLCSDISSTFLSSGVVKQVASFGGDISSFVPAIVLPEIVSRLRKP
ncbi:MAG: pantetheine-phosphate adenylyltransferase [Oscillospiraceae bacterium]|jgi:pantetheine-phosphate adenylyltransferase|nr:pantetheine-phosphate adenylyltransferase [Oscillospiraceae bacterium]